MSPTDTVRAGECSSLLNPAPYRALSVYSTFVGDEVDFGSFSGFDDADDVDTRMHRVLSDLAELRLRPNLWTERLELIDRLATAVEAGDAETADRLIITLEMLSGDRVDRIGAPGSVPIPANVRERIGLLVHPPEQDAPAGNADADQREARAGQDGRRSDKKR